MSDAHPTAAPGSVPGHEGTTTLTPPPLTPPAPPGPPGPTPNPPAPFAVPVPPAARQILAWQPPGASRAAWHAARRAGVGASEALAVLGLNKWTTVYKLWMEKTGRLPPEPARGRMRWGIRMEPTVAEWFTEETGIRVAVTGTWAHHAPLPGTAGTAQTGLALCNPDRLTEDGVGLEIKTVHPFSPDAKTWRTDVPDYPEAQAQWGMGVTGFGRWWVAAQIDGAEAPEIYQVQRDQPLIDDMFAAAGLEFWVPYVATDLPPPIDDSPITGKALDAAARITGTTGEIELGEDLLVLLATRNAIKDQRKALKADLAGVENVIKELMGGHRFGQVNGKTVVEYVLRNRAGYTAKACEYMELRGVKGNG